MTPSKAINTLIALLTNTLSAVLILALAPFIFIPTLVFVIAWGALFLFSPAVAIILKLTGTEKKVDAWIKKREGERQVCKDSMEQDKANSGKLK